MTTKDIEAAVARLNTCQFCGGKPTIGVFDDEGDEHLETEYLIDPWSGIHFRLFHDADCPIRARKDDDAVLGNLMYDTLDELVDAWNKRASAVEIKQEEKMNGQPNNTQINETSYYRLPCGKYLEDFIAAKGMSFALGSAVKYKWRAGKKDGESFEKDLAKARHYTKFLDINVNGVDWDKRVDELIAEATAWDGSQMGFNQADCKEDCRKCGHFVPAFDQHNIAGKLAHGFCDKASILRLLLLTATCPNAPVKFKEDFQV